MDEILTPPSIVANLHTRIKVKRGFFSSDWVDVKIYEFTPQHCIIKTDEIYNVGASMIMSMRFKLDMNEIVIEELTGTVLKKRKDCSCFHYFVEFAGMNDKTTLEANKIKQIDSIIRKKKALNSKINNVARQ